MRLKNCCYLLLFFLLLFFQNKGKAAIDFDHSYILAQPEGEWIQVTIPLKRVGNLFLLEATVDSLHGNFILDTGAPHLILNQTYFRNAKTGDALAASGIGSNSVAVLRYNTDSLRIGELLFNNVSADVIPLGHIENIRGAKILGLIGTGIFYNMEIELDAENNTLQIYKTDKQGNRLESSHSGMPVIPDLHIPMQVFNDVLLLEGIVNGKKLRFVLDTGAEINLLDKDVPKKVMEQFQLTTRQNIGGSTNSKIEVLNGRLEKLHMGEKVFVNMPFALTSLGNLQEVYGIPINGILGYDFFASGRVIINMKKKLFIMYFYSEKK